MWFRLFLAALAPACVVDVRWGETSYACEAPGQACPPGYLCVAGECRLPGDSASADARGDALAAAVDAGADATPGGWWDQAYARRRRLAVDGSWLSETLIDVPILVTLDATRLDFTAARSDLGDLRFVAADGTLLTHEVESRQAGTARLWVRLPSLAPAVREVWLYYGAPSAAPPPAGAGVWSAEHAAVWHLEGDADDSTGHANHGSLSGPTPAEGIVGGGLQFRAAELDYVLVPDSASLQAPGPAATVSAWVKRASTQTTWRGVVTRRRDLTASNDFWLGLYDDAARAQMWGTGTEMALIDGPQAPLDGWMHIAFVHDGTNVRLYVDGMPVATPAPLAGSIDRSANPVILGADINGGPTPDVDWLDATVDEVRIESVARTPDWMRAQVASMRDALIDYGPDETRD